MRARNNLVELARFLFSVLVVGYHIQMTFSGDNIDVFENGALAVEFFFLISGYFLARSIEKISAKEKYNPALESCRFMGNKVKGILPTHATAVIAILIVILVCDLSGAGTKILHGLPSVFLVQEAVIWNEGYANALIVPEWYLSSMLLCMLFIVPIALLLRKKIKGIFVILVLLGVLGVVAVIYGLCMNWAFTTTFVYDLRAWGEMCVGMFAYYLSTVISKRDLKPAASVVLKIVEIIGYCAPIVLGVIPISASLQPVCMVVAVVGVFAAISITFAGKGLIITNARLNAAFGYLGSLSLAIYLFHPVVISLLEYIGGLEIWAIYLVVFAVSVVAAIIFNLAALLIKKLITAIKNRKQREINI
ncbi:MAG: acyltransferase [Clostridia bacterium]|nr:acyltransferase [Clostridia bacterium]